MSTVAWKDNKELYPPFDTICKALQDPGKETKKGKKNMTIVKYCVLSKFALDIHTKLLELYPKYDGLDTNVSRGNIPYLCQHLKDVWWTLVCVDNCTAPL